MLWTFNKENIEYKTKSIVVYSLNSKMYIDRVCNYHACITVRVGEYVEVQILVRRIFV